MCGQETHREGGQPVQNDGGVNEYGVSVNYKQFNFAGFCCFYMRIKQNPILNNLKHHFKIQMKLET